MQSFREQKYRRNDQSGLQRLPYNVMQIMQAHFKYFQVQTHVQTTLESPDLNMDSHSFDNGCQQLYARIGLNPKDGFLVMRPS